jgi:hypothetical protein
MRVFVEFVVLVSAAILAGTMVSAVGLGFAELLASL